MIRKASRADRPRISEIRFAVRENRPSNPALIERLVDWLFDNSTFWVWEEDGPIQGFSAADHRDGSICALFVNPIYERRGIGRALLDRQPAQILAIDFEQVERAEHRREVRGPGSDQVERCETGLVADDGLTVDQAGPHRKRRDRRYNQGKPLGENRCRCG
jgi:GNAT superfamily N-acetyltransferase